MIVFRYLIGEVFKSQLAVFLILITIIMSQRFVKILADASDGDIPGQLVLTILSLKLPQLAVTHYSAECFFRRANRLWPYLRRQ